MADGVPQIAGYFPFDIDADTKLSSSVACFMATFIVRPP